MSANVQTDICFSFFDLAWRDGGTGSCKDSYEITSYEELDYRTLKDSLPSIDSPIARLMQDYPIKSCTAISHIYQVNYDNVVLDNIHQFTSELCSRHWTFVHNSQLHGHQTLKISNFLYQVRQKNDSEQIFC